MSHIQEVADIMAENGRLREALINARSMLRAFGGDPTDLTREEAEELGVDMIQWTLMDQIRAALGGLP